jgi:endo-1,4-beta-mannosidase
MFNKTKPFLKQNLKSYLVNKILNQILEVQILTIKSTLMGFNKFINKKLMLEDRQRKKESSTILELIKTIIAEIMMALGMNLLVP